MLTLASDLTLLRVHMSGWLIFGIAIVVGMVLIVTGVLVLNVFSNSVSH